MGAKSMKRNIIPSTSRARSMIVIIISQLSVFGDHASRFIGKASGFFGEVVRQIIMDVDFVKTRWINCIHRIVVDVSERIYTARKSDRIFRDESAHLRVVEAGAVVVEAGVGIKLAASIGVAR